LRTLPTILSFLGFRVCFLTDESESTYIHLNPARANLIRIGEQKLWDHTTVTRRWIAENLMMGYESGVSRAVSFVASSAANEVMAMKSTLRNANVR
jgi:hypothetical protein